MPSICIFVSNCSSHQEILFIYFGNTSLAISWQCWPHFGYNLHPCCEELPALRRPLTTAHCCPGPKLVTWWHRSPAGSLAWKDSHLHVGLCGPRGCKTGNRTMLMWVYRFSAFSRLISNPHSQWMVIEALLSLVIFQILLRSEITKHITTGTFKLSKCTGEIRIKNKITDKQNRTTRRYSVAMTHSCLSICSTCTHSFTLTWRLQIDQ